VHDERLAGVVASADARARGADQEIGAAVAVDIASHRDRCPERGTGAWTQHAKATGEPAGGRHRSVAPGAKHHVGGAHALAPRRAGIRRADEEIAPPVAVDVSGVGQGAPKAAKARRPAHGQVRRIGKVVGARTGASGNHVDGAATWAARQRPVDGDVALTIAVEVVQRGHRGPNRGARRWPAERDSRRELGARLG
jgi:hypothetical protein